MARITSHPGWPDWEEETQPDAIRAAVLADRLSSLGRTNLSTDVRGALSIWYVDLFDRGLILPRFDYLMEVAMEHFLDHEMEGG